MPLPIAHGLVGASLVSLIHPTANSKNWKPLLIGFVLANSPDLDFAGSIFFGLHGFHRGFIHSLFFAVLVAGLIFILLRKNNLLIPLAYSAAFFSHTILDYITAKSGGVRLFSPFDYTAYKLGLISFSELTRGIIFSDIFYFSLFEILVLVPLFLTAIFIVKKKNLFSNS
ncbi:MAG: metal-dependent hydrolase [Pyrinomonadaceae bacterium]